MDEILEAFEAEKQELDIYFSFVHKFEKIEKKRRYTNYKLENVKLSKKAKQQKNSHNPPELRQILLSNSYLLLYAMVEKFVRKGISHIIETVGNLPNEENNLLDNLNEALQKLWRKEQTDAIMKAAITVRENYIFQTFLSVFTDKRAIKLSEFQPAGNIDAEQIEFSAKCYGFLSPNANYKKACSLLRTIKDNRNNLAHGRISFVECAAQDTSQDILTAKKEIFAYVGEFLNQIKTYIDNENYLKQC